MSEHSEFWQELSRTVMLRGDSWEHVVESLPERISAFEARKLIQSSSQLTQCNMRGVAILAGAPVYASPDPAILSRHLPADNLSAESIVMQWLYQFAILEGLARGADHLKPDSPMADWPVMLLDLYVNGLHFMSYMAALLCLLEEGGVPVLEEGYPFNGNPFHGAREVVYAESLPVSVFSGTEAAVKRRIEKATENLYRKAQDYGESFRRHGVLGLLPRLWDKVARYAQLRSEHHAPNFESVKDSARDLLGYSAIAWSLVLEIPAAQNIQKQEVER